MLIFNVVLICDSVIHVLCLVAQSCLTLCDSMKCSLPGSSVPGDHPGKNTGVGSHALLQGIFPTQGLNPSLPHGRQIPCCLTTMEAHTYIRLAKKFLRSFCNIEKLKLFANPIYILFFIFFSIMAYHRILNILPCAIE